MLRIGTCSWKYDSWEGLIYSGSGKNEYLKEYAQKFNTVEIDQWFWSLFPGKNPKLPDPKTVEQYNQSVPDNFKFSIKVPNSLTLTHLYKKYTGNDLVANPHFLSPDLFDTFIQLIKPFNQKIGPLIFQFEYLNKLKMPSQQQFLLRLEEFFNGVAHNHIYSIEIRNPNYLNEHYFGFLNVHGLSHVFLEGYYMPSVVAVYKKFKSFIKNNVVIRLIGPERNKMEEITGKKWNKIVAPKDDALKQIAGMISELLDKNVDVYVNVNNHYEGSAPLTIEKLKNLLK